MSGFTPGPWRVGDGSEESLYEGDYAVLGNREDCGSFILCRVNTHFGEATANARLMSSAPELYEACRLALKDFDTEMVYGPVRDAIEAALRKAEGL